MARRTRSTRGRRRTRRARRRTAKKRGGEQETKYFKKVDGTVYEFDSEGKQQGKDLGKIRPTSTDEIIWINLDDVSPPGTPTGI